YYDWRYKGAGVCAGAPIATVQPTVALTETPKPPKPVPTLPRPIPTLPKPVPTLPKPVPTAKPTLTP
ncbi:MAG TPA: hypothetical protein VKY74_18395, partial [Chloroflexia bacterium]|nr:hypothetical protein [Chloroflexia bacterium]